ncbi:MAG: S26 family signal peptidase [Sandaracinaceae bacterium]|nr:S26 family signal peptidase [Sandaracinaceae bacterium]
MRDFLKGALKFLGVVLVIALIAGGVLYAFFVKVVEVGHNAMAPTMILGDRVLVWNSQDFELGEVVLCPHPQQPGRYVMGRVVGRPGQIVSFERGSLTINGQTPPPTCGAWSTSSTRRAAAPSACGWRSRTSSITTTASSGARAARRACAGPTASRAASTS